MATSPINTYTAKKLEPITGSPKPLQFHVEFAASLDLPMGTILGQLTANPGRFTFYNNGAADGSEVARAILPYGIKTDANRKITLVGATGETVAGGDLSQNQMSLAVYFSGAFATEDLRQSSSGAIDAAAVTDLGRLLFGTTADGVLLVS